MRVFFLFGPGLERPHSEGSAGPSLSLSECAQLSQILYSALPLCPSHPWSRLFLPLGGDHRCCKPTFPLGPVPTVAHPTPLEPSLELAPCWGLNYLFLLDLSLLPVTAIRHNGQTLVHLTCHLLPGVLQPYGLLGQHRPPPGTPEPITIPRLCVAFP